jgi:uncharacterized membrane protein
VPQVAFLLVAGFLLLNKVWSPQYSLWLLPLAVLARPGWRALLLWQATEALLWVPLTSWSPVVWASIDWSEGPQHIGAQLGWFFLALVLRDVVVVVLMGLVVRDILRPDADPVRAAEPDADDPAGGILEHAPDRATIRRRSMPPSGSSPEGGSQRGDLLGVRRRVARGLEDDRAVSRAGDLDE